MPAGDGTGPLGMGPMTGRAAGFCAGYPTAGFMNSVPGRGRGIGRGRGGFGRGLALGFRGGRGGFGWGPGAVPAYPYAGPYAAAPTAEQEKSALTAQVAHFENMLKDIKARLDELQNQE